MIENRQHSRIRPGANRFLMVAFAAALLPCAPAVSAAASGLMHGHNCVDTVVTHVHQRTFIHQADGTTFLPLANYGAVEFASKLGEEDTLLYGQTRVTAFTEYGDGPGDEVAAAERAGDRVQLCLMKMSSRTASCDPATDDRGREYRVYDYRQRAAYSGLSGEHLCGGA